MIAYPNSPAARGLLLAALVGSAAGALGATLVPTDDRRLDGIQSAATGEALPPGWDVRPVSGEEAPATEVVVDPDFGQVLRFESVDQAAFFGRELETRIRAEDGRLSWSWRVERTLPGAELRTPDADDSLARLMVVFGDRGLFSRPHILFYTWGNAEEVGAEFASRVSDKMHIIVLRNDEDPTEAWVMEERDLLADYRAVFGEDPDEVTAIGFMSDTENLPTFGVSYLGPVVWTPAD